MFFISIFSNIPWGTIAWILGSLLVIYFLSKLFSSNSVLMSIFINGGKGKKAVTPTDEVPRQPDNIDPIIKDEKPKNKEAVDAGTELTASVIADQYYYLPTASLTIKATARVVLTKSALDNTIYEAKLSEILLDNTLQIEPDTSQLIALRYRSFWF